MTKSISSFLLIFVVLQILPSHLSDGYAATADQHQAISPYKTEFVADDEFYEEIAGSEADFIASCQLPSGAVAQRPYQGIIADDSSSASNTSGYTMTPYFSNLTMRALLEKPEYSVKVRSYMNWYFRNLNTAKGDYNGVAGTIYDYSADCDGLVETSLRKYDSTDSYAATFLSLLKNYAEKTGDSQYLLDRKGKIDMIAKAMLATLDNGLTYAKPDYRVQFLMDNCEVYKGSMDMAWMYEHVFNDKKKSEYYKAVSQTISDNIENRLWRENTLSYGKYREGNMHVTASDLSKFYPDATSQLYPIWTGMLSPDDPRAVQIYNSFNKNFPGWPLLKDAGDFPWALVAYTAAVMGDKPRVDTFLKTVSDKYVQKGHPYKWYNLEAGMTMLAAERLKNKEVLSIQAEEVKINEQK